MFMRRKGVILGVGGLLATLFLALAASQTRPAGAQDGSPLHRTRRPHEAPAHRRSNPPERIGRAGLPTSRTPNPSQARAVLREQMIQACPPPRPRPNNDCG